ncbi:hypothetical protein K3495_g14826 [Podosphaera aphanis]|nr:hypothetical protein K3495_g14826 [Podosphaera aphanis]
MSNLKDDTKAVILKDGVPFTTWSSNLRGALATESLVGHVFHDHPGIRAKPVPAKPTESEASSEYESYRDELETWTMKDLQACSIILRRLDPIVIMRRDPSIRPESNNAQTALELYNLIADTHKPSVATPFHNAYVRLVKTKLTTTANEYCTEFQRNLQKFRNAASSLELINTKSIKYGISEGMVSIMFFEGTAHVEWVETWRATGAMDRDQQTFASLEQMMATLRSVSSERRVVISTVAAATPSAEDQCHIHPQLNHTNKECRAQHPERRDNKRKSNGIFQKKSVNFTVNQEASDSDGCTTAMYYSYEE